MARGLIRARSDILRSIRDTLFAKGFLEVETPILQRIHGGANARPFQTHINAYDLDLYLRIAPSCTSSDCAWAAWSGCSNWAGPSATKAWTSATTGVHPPGGLSGPRRLPHLDRRLPRDHPERGDGANGAPVVMRPDGDTLEAVDISG